MGVIANGIGRSCRRAERRPLYLRGGYSGRGITGVDLGGDGDEKHNFVQGSGAAVWGVYTEWKDQSRGDKGCRGGVAGDITAAC